MQQTCVVFEGQLLQTRFHWSFNYYSALALIELDTNCMKMIPYKSLFLVVVKKRIIIIPNRKFRIESSLIKLNLLKPRKLCLAVVTHPKVNRTVF